MKTIFLEKLIKRFLVSILIVMEVENEENGQSKLKQNPSQVSILIVMEVENEDGCRNWVEFSNACFNPYCYGSRK